jgi:cardiolipin synthase
VHRVLKKDQIFTIPNLLSVIRLLMIPQIIWLYCEAHRHHSAVAVVMLSGITDIADGIIARKYKMVSDFGKILDPVADKLTQASLTLCLAVSHRLMILLIIEFAFCEACMLVMGYITILRHDSVNSSRWHGKLTTVVLYAVMTALILFPGIPAEAADGMIIVCGVIMLMSQIMYIRFYMHLWREAEHFEA